jgi:peptidoglycan hydrolase-like protein with peptidoglycan-binding domain
VPGIASRNQVILFKQGKGFDGDAEIRKFGINFSLSTGTNEGQAQALRTLVEMASIELFGRLAKVPYWTCLGATDEDPDVQAEIRDWYDAMVARPTEIIEYFQLQLRMRRVYDGPVDGVVNPQIKEAVARYREALGLSREPKLSQDFLRAYLKADHRQLEGKVQPVPPAPVAEAPAAPVPAAAAKPAAAAAPGPLALRVATANDVRRFARGEAVQLTVRPNRDAHVYCFLQDENQRISRFFPNRFQKDSRVGAAQGVSLPGQMRFEIRMNPRGVQETVSCFATERDVLPDLPAGVAGGDFDPLPVGSLEQVRTLFVNATGGVLAQEYFHVQPK